MLGALLTVLSESMGYVQDKREWMEKTLAFYQHFAWDMVRLFPLLILILHPPMHCTTPPTPSICPVAGCDRHFAVVSKLQTVSNTHVTIPELMLAVVNVLSARSPRFHVRSVPAISSSPPNRV